VVTWFVVGAFALLLVVGLVGIAIGGLHSTGSSDVAAPGQPGIASGPSTSDTYGVATPATGGTAAPTGTPAAGTSVAGAPAAGAPAPKPAVTLAPPNPSGVPRLLFGLGAEASTARSTALVTQAPVRMLSSWYNSPNDLSWLSGWRTGTVPHAYAAGYAMHLIVWTGDSPGNLSTAYGPACGRGYPLSSRFLGDMQQLAQIFAGPATGPPLYVTLFTEFQTYPCIHNAWNPDTMTTNYYLALQDQYRHAYAVFHQYAPNAHVSLGWGGWQASYDDPATGAGRSMFSHFDSIMRMSDFQSFQAMDDHTNTAAISAMVSILGKYGPVMLAHYKPNDASQTTFDADVHVILTDSFLSDQVRHGLFAMSFMDNTNLNASATTLSFVTAAIRRYGTSW
jgi:hypothetical protein